MVRPAGRLTLARKARDLDEDDVRSRANPRGTRPRSKQRPAHADAADGMVFAVDRGRYGVLVGDTEVTAMRARELGRASMVVGDRVGVVGDLSGAPDALARIVRLDERETVLRRTADDNDPHERVIVANADQLVIVSALADPEPSYGFIDRCLVAALTAGHRAAAVPDQGRPRRARRRARAATQELSVPAVVTQRDGSLDELRAAAGRATMSVLVGHSGVGKSTLINALVPSADRAIGAVSAIGKGRHTSSSAVALRLPDGAGWVIDTPGVRSFGLAHVTADDLLWAFPDLEDGADAVPARLRAPFGRRRVPSRRLGGRGSLHPGPPRRLPPAPRQPLNPRVASVARGRRLDAGDVHRAARSRRAPPTRPGARGQDLGDDRHRDLGGRVRVDVEPGRTVDAVLVGVGDAVRGQPLRAAPSWVCRAPSAADVAGARRAARRPARGRRRRGRG